MYAARLTAAMLLTTLLACSERSVPSQASSPSFIVNGKLTNPLKLLARP